MSGEQQSPPPSYEPATAPAEGTMAEPPPYSYAAPQPPPDNPAGYPQQPPAPANQAAYPKQPTPANPGYPQQPPATGYPQQPPAGYPQQPPAGYPQQPPVVGQPGYGPQPPPSGADVGAVIVTQPPSLFVQNMQFRETPAVVNCPNCHSQVTSQITREVGGMTMLLMGGICVMGCSMGCCLIPLCIDFGKDVVHTCPTCNFQMGRFSHI